MQFPFRTALFAAALTTIAGVSGAIAPALAAPTAPHAAQAAARPSEQVVKRFFAVWVPYTSQAEYGPPLAKVAPLLTPGFYAIVTRGYDRGAVEFDPFTGSQEGVVSAKVLPAARLKDHDVVSVALKGAGPGPTFTVKLKVVHTGGVWRIDDVNTGDDHVPSVRKFLKEALAP